MQFHLMRSPACRAEESCLFGETRILMLQRVRMAQPAATIGRNQVVDEGWRSLLFCFVRSGVPIMSSCFLYTVRYLLTVPTPMTLEEGVGVVKRRRKKEPLEHLSTGRVPVRSIPANLLASYNSSQ